MTKANGLMRCEPGSPNALLPYVFNGLMSCVCSDAPAGVTALHCTRIPDVCGDL